MDDGYISEDEYRRRELVNQEYFEPMGQGQNNINEVFLDQGYVIDELMNTLRGQVIDSMNNKISSLKPLIPEEAISWLVSKILPYTSKIFSLSKLSEEKIREMVYAFATTLSGDLMYSEKYGIKREHRDYVYDLTTHAMEATLRKAHDGITMIRMLSQHQVKEVYSRDDRQKEGNLSMTQSLRNRFKI